MASSQFDGSHVTVNMVDLATSTMSKPNYPTFRGGIHAKENISMPLLCEHDGEYQIDDGDKNDYEPIILSIGPYHNGKPATKGMQIMKYECLDYVLSMNSDKKLEDYLKAMKELENQIRSCYHGKIEMDRNKFLEMILLDGCFVLMTLHGPKEISPSMPDIPNVGRKMKTYEKNGEFIIDMEALEVEESEQNIQTEQEASINEDDQFHNRMEDLSLCSRDILLLENQIPFFVITRIYEIAMGGNNKTSLLIEKIAKSIEETIGCFPKSLTTFDRPKEFYHLLHLCHMYFKPSKITFQNHESLDRGPYQWHRATEYSNSGISIKKKEFSSDNPHFLLDIEYCNGTMEIPCLTFDDNTRCLFKNLIAFERTCPQIGNHVNAYVFFLSQFIGTPEDAALLTKKGIIIHQLNSDADVCDIFTKLTAGLSFDFQDGCYLNSTCSEIEAHYQSNKTRLMTRFRSIASDLQHWLRKVK